MSKKKVEKTKKLALKDYYNSLPNATFPRTEFINKITSACNVSFSTARNWVLGLSTPKNPEKVGALLSSITGIPQEKLWE